ncbi:MAG TPA: DNA mismatch repair protein MutS [Candidatus Aminicenantes bacterium]|nr:DNA mismatch repair protein MutS [Candidatus Aminicenantes bacterium]
MARKEDSLTPMMEQYHRIKSQHRDCLLFFRLGDFYEMFYEDAFTGSSVLGIALTSRQNVPMCGVPYHAVNSYLARLLKAGYKVAICEQVEDPKQAKGVVKREVIKVLTPGTAVEVETGERNESFGVFSLTLSDDRWGAAYVDLLSGKVSALEGESKDKKFLLDEIYRFFPQEIICPESQEKLIRDLLAGSDFLESPMITTIEDWSFEYSQAANRLTEHFQVMSLESFGLQNKTLAISAAGALLFYLKKNRKESVDFIRKLAFVHNRQSMILDAIAIRNLELVKSQRNGQVPGSLLGVIDYTLTSPGNRLLKDWLLHPLLDSQEIWRRQEAVEEAVKKPIIRQEIRNQLKKILDLERLSTKISLAAAGPRDLVALKKSLWPLPEIYNQLKNFSSPYFTELIKNWDNGEDLARLIDRAILDEPAYLLQEGGLIKEGYHQELDELRAISHSGKSIIAQLERKERERTGISSLKVRYNKIFGYYIEVTKANLSLVPKDYERKQTLINCERFVTPELKEYEAKILQAEARSNELEYELFLQVREEINRELRRLQQIAQNVAVLDVLLGLAELAHQRNYCRPEVDDREVISIIEGRHPVIEVLQKEPFIPNDTYLDREGHQILIITGPNMGGKSTYLRQVALICILAQMGSFVPAKEARLGLVDRLFTRVGATDYLTAGQSTFMVEMIETANILNNATERSLILLDEVGRGTSTFDGLSIAWAVAEYLHQQEDIRPKTLFATHYHELTELASNFPRIKNFHVAVREFQENVVFLRKIKPGPSDKSYGLQVAKLAGLPREIIRRAREILFNLEKLEIDEEGKPRLAYHHLNNHNRNQLWLFPEDQEKLKLKEIKDKIKNLQPENLTPLQALQILTELKGEVDQIDQAQNSSDSSSKSNSSSSSKSSS